MNIRSAAVTWPPVTPSILAAVSSVKFAVPRSRSDRLLSGKPKRGAARARVIFGVCDFRQSRNCIDKGNYLICATVTSAIPLDPKIIYVSLLHPYVSQHYNSHAAALSAVRSLAVAFPPD